ncbi:MAG: signal peptidase II [Actinomycetota bacterium]|nr:signal peptidase II [Actinomycetota bacterium]MDQ2958389.1 signal peptidase II [Actinomycetota bacterium]
MKSPQSSEPPVPGEPAVPGQTRLRVFIAVGLTAVLADLVSKLLVVANIKPDDPGVRLLGGAIYLVQARNSGAAFSVGTSMTVILTAISVIVAVIIVRAARRLTSTAWAVSLGLVLGGALGNLIDRFFRAPSPGKGHVVDWISLFANDGHIWPIFNLADSSIVIGGALAVLLSLLGVDFGGGRSQRAGKPTTEPAAGPDSQPEPQASDKPAHG